MYFLLLVTLLVGLPVALSNALGAGLGWYGRGRRGALLGVFLAPLCLVFLPLMVVKDRYQTQLVPWYGLLLAVAAFLIWPKRNEAWRMFKASNLRTKRYNNRWKAASWSQRWTLTFQKLRREAKLWSLFVLLEVAVISSPCFLRITADLYFPFTQLRLLPNFGEREVFLIVLALQGFFVGLAGFMWTQSDFRGRTITRHATGCGLLAGLIVAFSWAWTNCWRTSELIALQPLPDGKLLYKIDRTPSRPLDGSIHLTSNVEMGFLDPATGEKSKIGAFDRYSFPRLSPRHRHLTYKIDQQTVIRNLQTGEELKLPREVRDLEWLPDEKALLTLDEQNHLFLFDLATRAERKLASDVDKLHSEPANSTAYFTRLDELQTERLWKIDLKSGESRRLTGEENETGEQHHHKYVSRSHDGRWLVYGERTSNPNEKRQFDLWLLDLSDLSRHSLTRSSFGLDASWGPSGKLLVRNGEEVRVWDPEQMTSRDLKLPSSLGDLTDEDDEKRHFRIEWRGREDGLVHLDLKSGEPHFSKSLDKDWQSPDIGNRGLALWPETSDRLLLYGEALKSDFFQDRRGYSDWTVFDLTTEETLAVVEWDGKGFVVEPASR